jgi:hypothetical protein
MGTTLFFLVPIGMLAIAWSLCFVGCGDTFQFAAYSDSILTEPSLVAYWPLSDLVVPLDVPGQTAGASDLSGNNHNGTYMVPPAYPGAQSSKAIAAPSVARGTSLVPGDAGSQKNPFPASANFSGGFVSIPWNTPNSTPADLSSFTFEAWIQPNFSAADASSKMFHWVVFSAVGPNNTGFVVFIDEDNNWQVMLGNGTTTQPVVTQPVPVNPNNPSNPNVDGYLAVTFDATNNNTLSLFLNPGSDTGAPAAANFTTTFDYLPVGQSQQMTFFIGAGDNNDAQNPRTQANGPGAPLLPFQGQIQSVALYGSALHAGDLQFHFQNGAGTFSSP